MSHTEQETAKLLNHIGEAFLSVFTEEERARTPEFEHERKDLLNQIAVDQASLNEIKTHIGDPDPITVRTLVARSNALRDQFIISTEQRGSFADKKYVKFMALIFPRFGITDFPVRPDSDTKLLMELLSRPEPAN